MIYSELYNLLQTYLFGEAAVGSNAELVCMLLASAGTVFLVAFPFAIVWKVFKML